MQNIFRIINTPIERKKKNETEEESVNPEAIFIDREMERPNGQMQRERKSGTSNILSNITRRGVDLEDILIGEEEKRYREKVREEKKSMDYLDEDIGERKDKKATKIKIKELDMIDLNKLGPKDQNRELKRAYIELLDQIKELSTIMEKTEKESSQKSMDVARIRKEGGRTRELIQNLVILFPDATELKRKMESHGWATEDLEVEIVNKIKFMVDRLRNADQYVAQEINKVAEENKILKRKAVQLEAEKMKLERVIEEGSARLVEKPKMDTYNEAEKEVIAFPIVELEKKPEIRKPYLPEPAYIPPVSEIEPELYKGIPMDDDDEDAFQVTMEKKKQAEIDEAEKEPEEVIDQHMLLNLDQYLQNLSDKHKLIIKIIGETGVSRNNELRPVLEAHPEVKAYFYASNKFDNQGMLAVVKSLRDSSMLESQTVDLGVRGHTFGVYELTALGKAIYHAMTNLKPAITEKKLVMNQHKSVEHGYLIKDVGTELKEQGYVVFDKREDLSIKLPNGQRKDFDLIAEKDGKKMHIEVERGTHTLEDFFDAMDKIYQITNEFYFVSPNEKQMYTKTKMQFYRWINERAGGVDKVKGKITVYFTTYERIKKRGKNIWEGTVL